VIETAIRGAALDARIAFDDMSTTSNSSDAALLAVRLLSGVGTRLAHSTLVASQAERARCLLDGEWRRVIVDAAWLHDIGYSAQVDRTGFHALDAARWLRDRGWATTICRLVAWHTESEVEGALRGLGEKLVVEFEPPPTMAAAALTWADLTSSPVGEPCTPEERIADILRRYLPGSIVHRAITVATPRLREATEQIDSRLALNAETT
jgi:hypothetical protein